MGRVSVNLREQATLILPWESKHGVMDVHNNDIGIEIGLKAQSLNEVVELARKKMAEAKSFNGDGGLNKDGGKRAVWMEKSRTNLWPSDWKKRKIPTYPMGGKDQTHPYNKPEKPAPPDDPIGGSDASADAGSGDAKGKSVDVAESSVKSKSASSNPTKEHSPEAKKMLAGLRAAKDTPEEILTKPVSQVTEDEVGDVIDSPPYWQGDLLRHKESQGLVRGVMEHVWGTGPAITDATGRPTDSAPINPYPKSPTPARAVDGGSITDGAYRVGRVIADREDDAGLKGPVSDLQSQLNLFPDISAYVPAKPLKIDGDFGPKTNDRLREVVRAQGSGPVLAAISTDPKREFLL